MTYAAQIIDQIYRYSLPISFIVCLLSYYNSRKTPAIILAAHTLAMIGVDRLAHYYEVYYQNNLFVSHIYFTIQLFMMAWLYSTLLRKNKLIKWFILSYLFVFVVIMSIIFSTDYDKFLRFNYHETFLTFYFFVVVALFFVYENIGKQSNYFYVNLGVLTYGFVACIYFMLQNLYSRTTVSTSSLMLIHNCSLLLFELSIIFQLIKNYFIKLNGATI